MYILCTKYCTISSPHLIAYHIHIMRLVRLIIAYISSLTTVSEVTFITFTWILGRYSWYLDIVGKVACSVVVIFTWILSLRSDITMITVDYQTFCLSDLLFSLLLSLICSLSCTHTHARTHARTHTYTCHMHTCIHAHNLNVCSTCSTLRLLTM